MDDGPNASDSALASLFHPGDVIGGRFTLRRFIDKSRAEVWLADQTANPSWPKSVALKLITNPSGEDASRLKEEHRICSLEALKDLACIPGSVQQDPSEVRGVKIAYLAREFVDGQNILKHANYKRLTIEARVGLMIKVCEGVGTLHDEGIGHRDLKPANILVDTKGQPKLIDFGSGVDRTKRERAAPTIVTERIHVSAGYEPPEAYGDDHVGAFKNGYRQWDVYSLGIVLADLLTGIRDKGPIPREIKPVEENDLLTHDTLRHMAESLTDAERDAAASSRGCDSVQAWLDEFDPLLEMVSLMSRHDSTAERYSTAGELAMHLRRWLATPSDGRLKTHPLKHAKRARAASIDEWNRYVSLITGVGALIRGNNHTQARRMLTEVERGVGGDRSRFTRTWEYRHLHASLHGWLHSLKHDDVDFACWSPDGRLIATAGGNIAKLWTVSSGECIAELTDHEAQVLSVAFSGDGAMVTTASADCTARLWRTSDGAPHQVLARHSKAVSSARFTPDGKQVVTISDDKTLRLWDARTGREIRTIVGVGYQPGGVSFATRSSKAVFRNDDDSITVADTDDWHSTARITPRNRYARFAALSHDGHLLAIEGDRISVDLYSTIDGHLCKTLSHPHQEQSISNLTGVWSAAFSSDASRLVTGDHLGTARIWHLKDDRVPVNLEGHSGGITAVSFGPDDNRVLTASRDGTASIWNAISGTRELVLPCSHRAVAEARFDPAGERVVTVSEVGTAHIWSSKAPVSSATLNAGEAIESVDLGAAGRLVVARCTWHEQPLLWQRRGGPFHRMSLPTLPNAVRSARFAKDGVRLLLNLNDSSGLIYDTAAERVDVRLRCIEENERRDTDSKIRFVRSAFSPSGGMFISRREDEHWTVHRADGANIAVLAAGSENADFSPQESHLLLYSVGQAQLWTTRTWTQVPISLVDDGSCSTFAFSGDDSLLAQCCADGTLVVYDLAKRNIVARFKACKVRPDNSFEAPRLFGFSPCNRFVVSSEDHVNLDVWSIGRAEREVVLAGHSGTVKDLAWIGAGSRLVTASEDATARVWAFPSGQEVAVLSGHSAAVTTIAAGDHADPIVTGSEDGTVRIWFAEDAKTRVRQDDPVYGS